MDKGKGPATKVQSLATTLKQKMKGLDTDLIDSEVFVRNAEGSSEFILGPCFRDRFSSELEPLYPLAKGEKLLLHSVGPECRECKRLKSWPHRNVSWIHWVNRMEKVKGEIWRTAGIYDAIQLSKVDIPYDKNLLCASLCFWSISTNSFHFNFGMMGPTILDIVALTALRPHGEEISAILHASESTFTLPKDEKRLSYGKFLEKSMKTGEVTEKEHISFLLLWLCKFYFCNSSNRITKGCTQLAIALAAGRKLALAPFVLAHLYRGCGNLVLKRFGDVGGPFWILQLWLQSYFPEYGPLTNNSQNYPSYGIPLAQGKLTKKTFQECFKFFYSCSSRTSSQFTPFSSLNHGPEWLRLSLHHHCGTSSKQELCDKQELSDIWSSYLIARDLHYGLVLDTSGLSKSGVEYYSPNQFARQFGMIQAVPLPPYQSANTSLPDRIVFRSVNCIQEVDSRFLELKKKFSAVHFDVYPKYTPSFGFWWSSYISKTRTESAEKILGRIFQLTPSLMQEQKDFRPENSENRAQFAGERATKKRSNEEYISLSPNSEGREKDERHSKRAERKLLKAGLPEIIEIIEDGTSTTPLLSDKGLPEIIEIIEDGTSTTLLLSDKGLPEIIEDGTLTTPLLSDKDALPSSSMCKTSVGGDRSSDQTKVGEVKDFFDRIRTQLQLAQSPEIDVRPSQLVVEKAELEVHKLLMMPLPKVFLPENYSTLVAALPFYAASTHLSVEKAQALKELERNLQSLFTDFQKAKKLKEDYIKKKVLIDGLTEGQDLYNVLKLRRSKIDIQISELKASLKEAKNERRAIQGQEERLKDKLSAKLAALEELGAESLDPQKELADSLITQVGISWANYKQKIIG